MGTVTWNMWRLMQEHVLLHTSQLSTQNNKYQVSHKYSCFSLWWAQSPETCGNWCRSICSYIPASYPHRITSTKCHINTVVSPDDGHIVTWNVWRLMQEHMLLHTSQSSTQNNKYQVSHKYSCFSWWWAHSRQKDVQRRNIIRKHLCFYCCTLNFVESLLIIPTNALT